MKSPLIAALCPLLLALAPAWAQLSEKPEESPGGKALMEAKEAFQKAIQEASRITFKKGHRPTPEELKKIFTGLTKKRKKAQEAFLQELKRLRDKFATDPNINRIRMALVEQLFNLGRTKEGKNELALVDPRGMTLKEKMRAIRIMNHFNMPEKASTMLIGLDMEKVTGSTRDLVVTLLAATGQKKRALEALEKQLADMIDAEDMWDQVDYMAKSYLRFGPSLARPLMALLYEEALRRYPDYEKAAERRKKLEALQLKHGSPALPLFGRDLEGEHVSLSALKGKVVLLYFFGSFDTDFAKEVKRLNKLYEEYREKGFRILGVSMDRPVAAAKRAAKEQGIEWPILCDGKGWKSDYLEQYAIFRIPFTMVVDKEGRVQGIGIEGDQLEAKIKELLD